MEIHRRKEQQPRTQERSHSHPKEGMPRWPAMVALLAIGVAYATVSRELTAWPHGLMIFLIGLLLVPIVIAQVQGRRRLARVMALVSTGLVTAAVVASATLLVLHLPQSHTPGLGLLRNAALIWSMNILIFGVWYWEIDAGGPAKRRADCHVSHDFLFPQMDSATSSCQDWAPRFTDYLFLAFNTSTAFSPTDTAALSRRAKVLMMAQSIISLLVLAVLLARAVSIL